MASRKKNKKYNAYDVFLMEPGPQPGSLEEERPLFTIKRQDHPEFNPNNFGNEHELYQAIMAKNSNMSTEKMNEIWQTSDPQIDIKNDKIYIKLRRPLQGGGHPSSQASSSPRSTPENTQSPELQAPVQCSSPASSGSRPNSHQVLQDQHSRLKTRLVQIEASHMLLESRHETLKERLGQSETEKDRLIAEKQQKERENAALEKEVEELKTKIDYIRNESDAHVRMLSQLEEEKLQLERNVSRMENQLSQMRHTLSEAKELYQNKMIDQQEAYEDRIRMLKIKNESIIHQKDDELKEKEKLLDSMKLELCEREDEFQRERESHSTELRKRDEELSQLDADLRKQKYSLNTATAALKSAKAKIELKETESCELKLSLAAKEELMLKMKAQHGDELEKNEKEFHNVLKQKDLDNRQVVENISRVNKDLNCQVLKLRDDIKCQMRNHSITMHSLQDENSELFTKLKEAEAEVRKLDKQVTKLANEKHWREEKSRASTVMSDSIEGLTRSHQKLSEDVDELRKDNTHKEAHIKKLQFECIELQKNLEKQVEETKLYEEAVRNFEEEIEKNSMSAILSNKGFLKSRLAQLQERHRPVSSGVTCPPISGRKGMRDTQIKGVKLLRDSKYLEAD